MGNKLTTETIWENRLKRICQLEEEKALIKPSAKLTKIKAKYFTCLPCTGEGSLLANGQNRNYSRVIPRHF